MAKVDTNVIYNLQNEDERHKLRSDVNRLLISRPVVEFGVSDGVKKRTTQQNSAAHLWFAHIADTFNESGLDMQATLAKRVGLRWTPEAVKEVLFKVLSKAMYQKESTTQLSSAEFSKVADMLADVIAKDYGLNIEFPTLENK